jgi:hypothetical protein
MFGIELNEVLMLMRQLGFVLAGATSLWVLVFSIWPPKAVADNLEFKRWLERQLYTLLSIGTLVGTVFHYILRSLQPVLAHEGMVLYPHSDYLYRALTITEPLVILAVILLLTSLFLRRINSGLFESLLKPFYLLMFLIFFSLVALPTWSGELTRLQFFWSVHGFHSIFTLGTVLVLDYLFFVSRKSLHLKQNLYPLFPTISKVIWAGLAIDFASTLLIFNIFVQTDKFLFAQTVIGILIINGVILSGPITRKLIGLVKSGQETMPKKQQLLVNLFGVISITSWLTITVIDFFENLSLSYIHLSGIYFALIITIFIGHYLFDSFDSKKNSLGLH